MPATAGDHLASNDSGISLIRVLAQETCSFAGDVNNDDLLELL